MTTDLQNHHDACGKVCVGFNDWVRVFSGAVPETEYSPIPRAEFLPQGLKTLGASFYPLHRRCMPLVCVPKSRPSHVACDKRKVNARSRFGVGDSINRSRGVPLSASVDTSLVGIGLRGERGVCSNSVCFPYEA